MDVPLTNLLEVATGEDGIVRGARVQVLGKDRIAVWTGRVDPSLAPSAAARTDELELRDRSVVHFIAWDQALAYYRDTPFASLVASLRQRALKLTTMSSDAAHE